MRAARRIAALAVVLASLSTGAAAVPEDTTSPSSAAVDARYREFGDAGGFASILASAHIPSELEKYGALASSPDDLTDVTLFDYYRDASFGVAPADVGRVYRPHPDVTIIRDVSANVPHIFGRTRYATMYAQGYATAEDRLFAMDVLRHLGRGRASELVGLAQGEALDRAQIASSPYSEADLREQYDRFRESSPGGASLAEDLEAYADGVNAYIEEVAGDSARLPAQYQAIGRTPDAWHPEDAVAIAGVIGRTSAHGGGHELANKCGLDALATTLGDPAGARAVFDDLTFSSEGTEPAGTVDPAEADLAITTTRFGEAERAPVDPASSPDIDCASLQPVSEAHTAVALLVRPDPDSRDNGSAVLVDGERTASGRPIAVFGPGTGYDVPELLTEKDVHGPGIDARGVGFLGIDTYVMSGRGDTYAWSTTASGADTVDQTVLALCDPNGGAADVGSLGYEHNGVCLTMEQWEHELQAPDGTRSWTVQRAPHYGPIQYRGRLRDGTPVAVAEDRSTYGAELDSARGLKELNDPEFMRDGYDAFRTASAEHTSLPLNWFYVDDTDIGYQHACRCPVRTPGTDAKLPVWGTGEWDSARFVAADDQPRARNPEAGYLVAWGNRPAPGWPAADDQSSWGPVHRAQVLRDGLEARFERATAENRKLDRSDVVEVVRDAGLVDVRGVQVLPLLLDAMQTPPTDVDPRVFDARERLEIWADDGARRVRRDPTAVNDAVAPAVMDAWWPRLVAAGFGMAPDPFARLGLADHDDPRAHRGGGFGVGAYGQMAAELRAAFGDDEPVPFTRSYCGAGDAATCELALWQSLALAMSDLEATFANPDVSTWVLLPAADAIEARSWSAPASIVDWQNRPTYQQVVQLESVRDRAPARVPPAGSRDRDDDSFPFAPVAAGAATLIGIAVAVGFRRRRRSVT